MKNSQGKRKEKKKRDSLLKKKGKWRNIEKEDCVVNKGEPGNISNAHEYQFLYMERYGNKFEWYITFHKSSNKASLEGMKVKGRRKEKEIQSAGKKRFS